MSHLRTKGVITKYSSGSSGSQAISVKAMGGTMRVGWDYALDPAENHQAAAIAYGMKKGWFDNGSVIVGAGMPDDSGYMFVWVSPADAKTLADATKKRAKR